MPTQSRSFWEKPDKGKTKEYMARCRAAEAQERNIARYDKNHKKIARIKKATRGDGSLLFFLVYYITNGPIMFVLITIDVIATAYVSDKYQDDFLTIVAFSLTFGPTLLVIFWLGLKTSELTERFRQKRLAKKLERLGVDEWESEQWEDYLEKRNHLLIG